jgi:hypothetical protein
MATINNAILFLDAESNNQVEVIIDCQLTIPPSEAQSQFRLDCTVFGSDLLRDDFLFSYESQFFFGFDTNTNRRFTKTVSRGLLNEDLVGRDEVVGKLTLRNVTLNKVVKRNTSVVEVVL